MNIGIDLDGVLADWNSSFQRVTRDVTGRDLFPANYEPHTWYYAQALGYTDAEMQRVGEVLRESGTFWLNLAPLPGMETLQLLWRDLDRKHDIYFITSRTGERVKRQTEIWLADHLKVGGHTVLISAAKGYAARALALDCYLDDNFDNVEQCAAISPGTRTYLLNAAYNQMAGLDPLVIRVDSVAQFFDHELTNL